MKGLIIAALACLVLGLGSIASAAGTAGTGKFGETAPDFPPGAFTDGTQYSIADLKGKVVVLYFGCPVCPRNRGSIPERNKVVEQFKGKPVKFLAITPALMAECKAYTTGTKLEMPCFADGLGVMQARYGTQISLQNIWQFRVIGANGSVSSYDMSADAITKALADVKWTYKDDKYDSRLDFIVEGLEWNQTVPAMQALRPYTKLKTKAGESAKALFEKVKKTVGEPWATEADAAVNDDKPKAFDLYTKLAACFPDDALGKHATDALKKLKTDKAVMNELAARRMYTQLYGVMSKATPDQKKDVIGFCNSISQRYPESPTGQKAAALGKELEGASVKQ
jgi:peroxiredoxin